MDSEQRALTDAPVVPLDSVGATALGDRYWAEVGRLARGVVRVVRSAEGVEVRLRPRGVRLLVLGPADLRADGTAVVCRYAILGGALARRPGGVLLLSQAGSAR